MDYPRNYSGIIDQGNEKGGKPYINSFYSKADVAPVDTGNGNMNLRSLTRHSMFEKSAGVHSGC